MPTLILLRHGQSQWNLENRFTGWVDVDLSPAGLEEARRAGDLLAAEGFTVDRAFTSVLKRAIRTLWISLDRLDQMWVPVVRSWQLNERHYGALQGLDKAETAAKYGDEQVLVWRRSYDTPPPLLDADSPEHPRFDRRYSEVPADKLPAGESLALTLDRVLPYWEEKILPCLKRGETVLVAAHGNSLRALVKHLDQMSNEAILKLNIPTAVPLIYRFNDDMSIAEKGYLGDAEEIAAAAAAVAAQGQSKT